MKKRIIITGATSGIGLETLKTLAKGDYEIIIGNRNPQKADRVTKEILSKNANAVIHSYVLDLSSFESIKAFSDRVYENFDYVDILFNNAGLFWDTPQKTKEDFEMTIGVNYIGTYYLTYLLADLISKGHNPQIINVNSRAAFFGHITYKEGRFSNHPQGFRSYAASKYMQLLWVYLCAEDFMKRGIRMNAIHPGDVATNLWRTKNFMIKLMWPILKNTLISLEEGAIAGLYLIENDMDTYGKMYQNAGELMEFKKYDEEKAKRLLKMTDAEIKRLGYKINLT